MKMTFRILIFGSLLSSACSPFDDSNTCKTDSRYQKIELYALPLIVDDLEQIVFFDEKMGEVLNVYASQTAVQQISRKAPELNESQLQNPTWIKLEGYQRFRASCPGDSALGDFIVLESVIGIELEQ